MPNERKRQYQRVAGEVKFQEQNGDRKELWKLQRLTGKTIIKNGMARPEVETHPSPVGCNPAFVATRSEALLVAERFPQFKLERA